VLVNNTGIVKDSLFASMSFDDFYSVINVPELQQMQR
jgi:3-oxoacyl-[acyl-carrier protein] reductase